MKAGDLVRILDSDHVASKLLVGKIFKIDKVGVTHNRNRPYQILATPEWRVYFREDMLELVYECD